MRKGFLILWSLTKNEVHNSKKYIKADDPPLTMFNSMNLPSFLQRLLNPGYHVDMSNFVSL